jgi:two-component system KDP operon response regulator KdpE
VSADAVTVLSIEDEPRLSQLLQTTLGAHGYRVLTAATAAAGLQLAGRETIDLILLDLGLPDRDGIELIPELRERSEALIIVVSARTQEMEKIAALDAGAEDYLTKPFSVGELMARLRVLLRRRQDNLAVAYHVAGLDIDLGNRRITLDGELVHLTPTEFKLMAVLAAQGGKVVTHAQVMKEVWGRHHEDDTHYLRIYMRQLRQKLEKNPAEPRYLLTEPGVGYRLASE